MVAADVSTSSESERAGKPRSLAWDEMTDTTCDECDTEFQSPSRQRRRRRGRGKRREGSEISPTKAPAVAATSEPQSVLELFGLTPKASERQAILCSRPPFVAQGNVASTPPAAYHRGNLQGQGMVCGPPAVSEFWSCQGEHGAWMDAQPVPQTLGTYRSYPPGSQQRMQTAFGTAPFRAPEQAATADASSRSQTETADLTAWGSTFPISSMSPKEQEALLQNLMPDAYEE